MQKFHEEKNQHAASFTNKNPYATVSTEKKTARNKFHEQNQFHGEKNQYTSFTKRKIKMQEIKKKNSRQKISSQ